ncbi:MAG: glyoxalase/bleomycin resistance/extradiol dioxygenase family protein [Catenulispora sp.]|nr:glyoxalase/bleomycin resistance/extradiol dioxygenase family protein [Catenulispora sp.]
MDALHPRLLVDRFPEMFEFYQAVLPALIGAQLVKGTADGYYANWDVDGQAVLVLFGRAGMTAVAGTGGLPAKAGPAQDSVMFVCRVDDVDAGAQLCVRHGATLVAPATDRPDWGPTLRTAHLRDPEGHLIELQSYEG